MEKMFREPVRRLQNGDDLTNTGSISPFIAWMTLLKPPSVIENDNIIAQSSSCAVCTFAGGGDQEISLDMASVITGMDFEKEAKALWREAPGSSEPERMVAKSALRDM